MKQMIPSILTATSLLVMTACTCFKPGKTVDATFEPPTVFDNPIIRYDTQDPTNEVGEIIYTADPAAMVLGQRYK